MKLFKRTFCIFLSFIILFINFSPLVFAQDNYKYGTLNVAKSNDLKDVTTLNVMINDGNLYVEAKEIAQYMGYEYGEKDDSILISKKDILRHIFYYANQKKVTYLFMYKLLDYEASCVSIKDGNHFWIPLHYTLKLMDSDIYISSDTNVLYIMNEQVTVSNTITLIHSLWCNMMEEFGTSQTSYAAGHLVNIFNGVLNLDPMSIGQLGLNTLFWVPGINVSHLYDSKYGEKISMLFCTQSQNEVRELNNTISTYYNLLYNEGALANGIENLKNINDASVGYWADYIEYLNSTATASNPKTLSLNGAYDNLRKSMSRQNFFNIMTDPITNIQDSLSVNEINSLDWAKFITDATTYAAEINTVDKSSINVLSKFCDYSKNHDTLTTDSSINAMQTVISQSRSASGRVWYTLGETFENNMRDIAGLSDLELKLFGAQGVLILAAWDIASNLIPFISGGIEGSEQMELALYCQIMQFDAMDWYFNMTDSYDAKNRNSNEELSSSAYAYLKFCYITRSSGLAMCRETLKGWTGSASDKAKVESYLNTIEKKNELIAKLLNIYLRAASGDSTAFGFSLADSEEFLKLCDDSFAIALVNFGEKESEDQQKVGTTTQSSNQGGTNRDIVLVLDTSGSMNGDPITETVGAATDFVTKTADGDTRIGLVSYSSRANEILSLTNDVNELTEHLEYFDAYGSTNMYGGLSKANEMLSQSSAKHKIIVLMSDGVPNESPNISSLSSYDYEEEVISYAAELKQKGYFIYTLGFFQNLYGSSLTNAQELMSKIASEGYYYDIDETGSITYFFNDIVTDISGTHSVLIKVTGSADTDNDAYSSSTSYCPVDVSVVYNGETLTSNEDTQNNRTSFGSITYTGENDEVKNVRLLEGTDYDIVIKGTGDGTMDYSISFPDDEGNYTDVRTFEDIPITNTTIVNTNTKQKGKTIVKLDSDGDGHTDIKYQASANSLGEIAPDYTAIYVVLILLVIAAVLIKFVGIEKIKSMFTVKYDVPNASGAYYNPQNVIRCVNCDSELIDNGAFCPNCGFDNSEYIQQMNSNSESSFKFCGNCGHQLNSDAVFCDNCGYDTRKDQ